MEFTLTLGLKPEFKNIFKLQCLNEKLKSRKSKKICSERLV